MKPTILTALALTAILAVFFSVVQMANAVPAAPSPTCEIIANVLKVEKTRTNIGGLGQPPREDFDYYKVDLDVLNISTYKQEGGRSCDGAYMESAKKSGQILSSTEFDKNPISEGQRIEATIHFGGDEWFGGYFLSDIRGLSGIGIAENGTIGAPTGPIVVSGTLANETIIRIIPGEGCTGDRCPLSEARTAPVLKGILETPAVSVEYEGGLAVSGSKLFMNTSAGQQQISVMPGDAVNISGAPLSTVKKVGLKEINQKPVYSVIATKQARLFFIMPVSIDVNTEVDAGTGSIISVSEPWWSFLAW